MVADTVGASVGGAGEGYERAGMSCSVSTRRSRLVVLEKEASGLGMS